MVTTSITSCSRCALPMASLKCEQCQDVFCGSCSGEVHEGLMRHHLVEPIEMEIWRACHLHPTEKLNFKCFDCGEIVCPLCLLTGVHAGHKNMALQDAYSEAVQQMRTEAAAVAGQIAELESCHDAIRPLVPQAEADYMALEAEVKERMRELHDVIGAREEALNAEVEAIHADRSVVLEEQMRDQEMQIYRMSAVVDRVQEALAVAEENPERFLNELDPLQLQHALGEVLEEPMELRLRVPTEIDILLDIAVYKEVLLSMELGTMDEDEGSPAKHGLVPSLVRGAQAMPGAVSEVVSDVVGVVSASLKKPRAQSEQLPVSPEQG